MTHDDDLKAQLGAHLDDALPTADERRSDLAVLGRVRPSPSFGLRAVLASAVAGALLVTVTLAGPGIVSFATSSDDHEMHIRIATSGHDEGALVVDGARRVYLRLIAGTLSDRAMPPFLGQKLVHLNDEHDSGFMVLSSIAGQVPGLAIEADACVDAFHLDVEASPVPAQVLLDAFVEKLGLEAEYANRALMLSCPGVKSAAGRQHLDETTRWPPESPLLDDTVSVDADDTPLEEVMGDVAKQIGAKAVYGSRSHPRVSLSLHGVKLRTALEAISDVAHVPVVLDTWPEETTNAPRRQIVAIGPDLPDLVRAVAQAKAKAAAEAEAQRKAAAPSTSR